MPKIDLCSYRQGPCTCLFEAFVASANAGAFDNRMVRAAVTKPAVASEIRAWFAQSLLLAADTCCSRIWGTALNQPQTWGMRLRPCAQSK